MIKLVSSLIAHPSSTPGPYNTQFLKFETLKNVNFENVAVYESLLKFILTSTSPGENLLKSGDTTFIFVFDTN